MMRRHRAVSHRAVISSAVISVVGAFVQASSAPAQSFDTYHCADGTQFILAFYPRDKRAYVQIDGRAIILERSVTLIGSGYSGGGVSLKITPAGFLLRHARRPVTACGL